MVGSKRFFQRPVRSAGNGWIHCFRSRPNHGATASTRDGAENLMSKLDQEEAGREIQSAVRGLQVHAGVRGKRLGVVGFSMGAFWGLWLAQELPADVAARSEERRVGKECRARWSQYD